LTQFVGVSLRAAGTDCHVIVGDVEESSHRDRNPPGVLRG